MNNRELTSIEISCLQTKRMELQSPLQLVLDLLNEVEQRTCDPDLQQDLVRMKLAADSLIEEIEQTLEPVPNPQSGDQTKQFSFEPGHRSKTRHEWLNRLNPIINYADMWIEIDDPPIDREISLALEKVRFHSQKAKLLFDRWFSSGIAELDVLTRASTDEGQRNRRSRERSVGPGELLVVDDNETNRDVLQRRLAAQGHRVTLAADGGEAWRLLEKHPFDLILLDIVMPVMNGVELLMKIKSDEILREIPVLMISSLDEVDVVAKCIELGAEDHLPKPFNPIVLQARIDACLEKRRLREREIMHLREIERERKRADELLHVILPEEIVSELKSTNQVTPRRHEGVAVLFADIVNFTPYCNDHPPEEVVLHLQNLVEHWEEIAIRHEVQKIKTIGDSFMAACGLLKPVENPVLNCVLASLEFCEATTKMPTEWNVRIGIDFGPVIAGVIGKHQYLYDLWGDTVNTASRMESHGRPGTITLSRNAYDQISHVARGIPLPQIPIKGKGPLDVYQFERFL